MWNRRASGSFAVDADSRWPDRTDIPTFHEAGIDQPKVASWFGLAAPAGTPEPVIRSLHDAFVAAACDPDVIKGVRESGALVTASSSDPMGRMMTREAPDDAALVRTLHLQPQRAPFHAHAKAPVLARSSPSDPGIELPLMPCQRSTEAPTGSPPLGIVQRGNAVVPPVSHWRDASLMECANLSPEPRRLRKGDLH